MTRQQPPDWWIDALAKVVYGIRQQTNTTTEDDARWDYPGIKASVLRIAKTVGPADTVKVMAAGADNPKIKTPAGIAEPGPQWSNTTAADRPQPKRCPDHGVQLQAGDCPQCARKARTSRPADFWDRVRQARQEVAQEADTERQEAIDQ